MELEDNISLGFENQLLHPVSLSFKKQSSLISELV